MMTFSGIYTPLITPFRDDSLDEQALIRQIKRQEEATVAGLVIFGTTGEAPTLLEEERERILSIAAKSSLQLIVGCTHASTDRLIDMVGHYEAADALLIAPPPYLKPTQEGIYRHFLMAASETDLPIIVYNIPSRVSVNIEPATLERLAAIENIVAIKECNLAQARCGALPLLCGDDASILSMMAMGAKGAIASSANVIPKQMVELVDLCQKNEFEAARELFYKLLPLFDASSWETNPIPCKAMMNLLGLDAGKPRMPLLPSTKTHELKALLWKLGFLAAPEGSPKPTALC